MKHLQHTKEKLELQRWKFIDQKIMAISKEELKGLKDKRIGYNFRVSNHFRPKKKIDKINKEFELFQVIMHNFICQNIWICQIYCLQEESIHFGLRVLTNVGLEISKNYGPKSHNRKIQ